MPEWARRIGGGGLAAIAAIVLVTAAIGYRVWSQHAEVPASAAPADPIADLERRAQAQPKDARTWQQLGLAYGELGRFDEAAKAYRRAVAADPKSAVLWSSLGEAVARASERDPMPPEARAAFAKAAALDPKDPRARYFLAVEQDLAGDHRGAIDGWLALLKDTPSGAPWDSDVQRTIQQVGKINHIEVQRQIAVAAANRASAHPAMPGVPGPNAQQLAAASSIPPGEQQQMAEGMVARLAARLQQQPNNVDGWIMLMRSYRTLGREADARQALAKALTANPSAKAQLSEAAASLGLS